MNKRTSFGAIAVPMLLFLCTGAVQARDLTFEDRVKAQEAIERVYWSHRVWPIENPQPKPPLSAVMSAEAIRAKVEDYLKKSSALETWWKRPVTAGQLQAEMDRMARSTRNPTLLRELFLALGNDPFLIAECVARPALADRLIHSWFADDVRFRGQSAGATNVPTISSLAATFDDWWVTQRIHQTIGAIVDDVAFVLPMPEPGSCAEDTWASMEFGVPDPRERHTAVWTGSEMIVWGGYEQGQYLNSGGRYNPATDTWTPTSTGPNVPEARSGHLAVWTGEEMIVWGGRGGGPGFRVGGRYNPTADTWRPTSDQNAPSPREAHTMVWAGNEIIIWGGYGGAGCCQLLNDGGRYDPSSDLWRPTSTLTAPAPRMGHTAVWTGTRMIVWGGAAWERQNTGGAYDPFADSWSQISLGENVPSARSGHLAVWTGSEMIIWGGGSGASRLTSGGRYDPQSDSWRPTSLGPNVPDGRDYAAAVWTGEKMVIWGGFRVGSINPLLNSGALYDPLLDTWDPTISAENVPDGRYGHTAVWTGAEMIVWGGASIFGDTSTGGRYAPRAEMWIPTGSGMVPSARGSHTAIWTGSEMIVWAGNSVGHILNTGGLYDPVTDAWRSTSTGPDVPEARINHTAVWTGTEMIVWGGNTAFGPLNSGGRYSPLTDTWSATNPSASAPEPRRFHTAVWTGKEMIVWGGQHGIQGPEPILNSGGRYDPASDTWRPTSRAAGVPELRVGHTAVWLGGRMIVWGGGNHGNFYLNTGGLYYPEADSWTATATGAGVPAPRGGHSAVAAGREMLIWGGIGGPMLNSGGRYDPESDTWTPIGSGGALPSPRDYTSAVWTGTEMIIWGGRSQSGVYLNSGGRYDPMTDMWTATSIGVNAPGPRGVHTGIWDGSEMIIWGGFSGTSSGGRYCSSGCVLETWHRDADGDGFGDPTDTILSCGPRAGFVPIGGDCNDSNPTVNPAAPDLPGDSVDQDCDGTLSCDPSADYPNHGEFVSCVSHAANDLLTRQLITLEVRDALMQRAARSTVGRKH